MIRATTKLDIKSYTKLIFQLTYRRPFVIVLYAILLMMLFSNIYLKDNIYEYSIFPFVFSITFMILYPIAVYFNIRKNYKSNQRIQENIIYSITSEKITNEGETFSSEMDWSKIYKVLELRNWILLYQSSQTANIISKKDFTENDLKKFREIVKSKNIKAKLRKNI